MKSPGFEGFKFSSYLTEPLGNALAEKCWETVRNNGGHAEAHTDERSELLLLTAWEGSAPRCSSSAIAMPSTLSVLIIHIP